MEWTVTLRSNSGISEKAGSMTFRVATLVIFLVMLMASAGVGADTDSFVQAVDRSPSRMTRYPQDTSTRRLLERFRPTIYVTPYSFRPMSFYDNYLPRTDLYRGNQRVATSPGRERLIQVHRRTGYHLDVRPSAERALNFRPPEIEPTLYGRMYGDTLFHGGDSVPLLFLKYSAVFPYSGLAYGTSSWKYYGTYLLGDPVAWHEGDIHGAIHVILHAPSRKPLGILVAQHNHHRVYLRGRDFEWPSDNNVDVSYATYANEPYLVEGRTKPFYKRTVGNPGDIETLYGREGYGLSMKSGYDHILPPEAGAEKVNYSLELIPHDDPLYRSRIPLGDRYAIWGIWGSWFREGPPGMDYYAPGWMKNLADLTAYWNINPEDDKFFQLYSNHRLSLDAEPGPVMDYQRQRLLRQFNRLIERINAP